MISTLRSWRVRVPGGEVLGLWQHPRVLLLLDRLCQECCGIAVGSSAQQDQSVPHSPSLGSELCPCSPLGSDSSLCSSCRAHPDLLGLMAPRFISPLPERCGNFLLLPFGDFSSGPAEEQPLLFPFSSWWGAEPFCFPCPANRKSS